MNEWIVGWGMIGALGEQSKRAADTPRTDLALLMNVPGVGWMRGWVWGWGGGGCGACRVENLTHPGMIPILHSPGLMIPGQFGPINRVFDCWLRCHFTLTMSCCGTPSVIATTSGISALMASMIAAAQNGGGT